MRKRAKRGSLPAVGASDGEKAEHADAEPSDHDARVKPRDGGYAWEQHHEHRAAQEVLKHDEALLGEDAHRPPNGSRISCSALMKDQIPLRALPASCAC